jgi:hypothetical protein
MTIPPAAAANVQFAREALEEIISFPIEVQGDAMIVEIATRLCKSLKSPVPPTPNEMFLAVMLALAVERLRGQEGFAE